MFTKRDLLVALATILVISLAFLAGYSSRGWLQKENSQFLILDQAYQILSKHSYQVLPTPPGLEYGMITGLLQASGDPYASFQEPTLHELETDSLEGNFGGIGVELIRAENGDVLIYPYPYSQALLAGIRAGDRLLAVDELAITAELPIETIQAAIRGSVDETVRLKVGRESGSAPMVFDVTRKEMPLPSISWRKHPEFESIGIIKLNIIASSTPEEILQAIQELKSQGVTSFILDLRDNGGGLLSESIEISRLFLSTGQILEQQYRGEPVVSYSVEKPGQLSEVDLAVLVNNNTASAAEIIAGAFKSNRRATIVGTPTFGKDTIQLVFNLDDGSSMHITAAKWWVPGLEPPIGGNGVQPDIIVQGDNQESDLALRTAAQYMSKRP